GGGPAGGRDERPREDRQEGEALPPRELIAGGGEWGARGRCGRLSHGDLLGVGADERFHRQLTDQGGRLASSDRAAQTRPRLEVTFSSCHSGRGAFRVSAWELRRESGSG